MNSLSGTTDSSEEETKHWTQKSSFLRNHSFGFWAFLSGKKWIKTL